MNQELGSRLASVTTGRSLSNALHIIGLGREDGLPYLTYQDSTGTWVDAGRIKRDDETPWSALAAGKGKSNSLHVIGIKRENGLPCSVWQDDKGEWHDAGRLSKDNSTPWSRLATGNGRSNDLQVIGLGGEDGLPYLIWQDGKGDWHDAGRLSKDKKTPWSTLVTGNGNSNYLQVIGLGREDGLPYLIWQDGKGDWHDAGRLSKDNNTPWSTLAAGRGNPNSLHVIGLGREDGLPYGFYQDEWGNWHDSGRLMKEINTPWSTLVLCNDDRNNLNVIGLGREDGLPYLMYLDSQGNWHDGGPLLKKGNTPWSSLAAGTGSSNSLQVIGLGAEDGLATLIYKDDKAEWRYHGLLPFGGVKLDRLLKPGEVLVFSEEDFQGREWLVTKYASSLDRYFTVASFRIGSKTGVTLYAESEYKGLSQELTAELGSFKDSKLQDQKPKSLRIWVAAGRAFTGYWAIEAAEGKYLSVHLDTNGAEVLTTSTTVSESEAFRIEDQGPVGPGRRKAAIRVRGTGSGEPLVALPQDRLTSGDLSKLTLVDEQEAGFRKFSLLVGNKWICYSPEEDRFRTSGEDQDRTIFCQSIKIAENETQVGELSLGEVALFENPCYWGKAWVFYQDYADFNRVLDLNDEVSSIQLGPLTGATIYREAQFKADDPTAGKQDVLLNIPSLAKEQVGEDKISSIDLWRITPPEGADVTFTCSLSQDFRGTGDTFEEYSAYRTSLRLPPTVETVEVWTTDATEIEVDDKTYKVDEDNPATLSPNLFHGLVITTDAMTSPSNEGRNGSLKAPGLKIRTNTMLPHERIVIFPDQHVHARLADMKEGELWNATINDKDDKPQPLIKNRSPEQRTNAANAQQMITKIMSTVKYSKKAYGGYDQSIAPEELHGQYWALDFSTYRVKAVTLYVREGPGTSFKAIGFLRKNDIVEALEFNPDSSWVRLRRISDGLSGWSAKMYMDKIADRPLSGDRYQVTASKLHVREGPGVEFRSLGAIENKEIVTAIGVNDIGSWRQICRSDGLVGWSSARYMTLVLPLPAGEEVIGNSFRVSGSLKVREGPGTDFKTVGYLQKDQIVEALEANADGSWLRVRRTLDGLTGWASRINLVRLAPTPAPAKMISVDITPEEEGEAVLEGASLAAESSFHEASKEYVEELLARAEAPDTDLAQGLFGDIFEGIKKCVSFVVAQVKQGLAVIINFVDKAVKWIVDTAEKAVAFVEGIFEKIGMIIEEIIKWLRFLFDWKDILRTRDILCEIITNALDYVGKTLVPKAKEPIKNFFESNAHLITEGFESARRALGDTSGSTPSTSRSGILDVIDWILSKVASAGQFGQDFAYAAFGIGGSSASKDDEDEKLSRFWIETLAKGLEGAAVIPAGVAEIITTLVKKPDQPLLAVAALLKLFQSLAVGILETTKDILLGLLDLLTNLIEKIKKIISAPIRIPFISDILEWVGFSNVTLGFSLLDVATLILAIPFTIAYKAAFNERPFKNVPSLAMEYVDWADLGLNFLGYISSGINSWVSMFLDAEPETNTPNPKNAGAEGFSLILAFVSWLPSLYGVIETFAAPSETANDSLEDERDALWWWLFGIESTLLVMDTIAYKVTYERFKRANIATSIVASVIGGAHIALMIWKGAEDKSDFLTEMLPDLVLTLPEPGSFLRIPGIPYGTAIIGGFDLFAGIAGFAGMIIYQNKFIAAFQRANVPVRQSSGI